MIFSWANIFDNIFIDFVIILVILYVILYVFEFIKININFIWEKIIDNIDEIIGATIGIGIGISILLLIYNFQTVKEKAVDIIEFIGFNGGYETINIAGERIQVAKEDLPEKMTRDEAERASEDLGDRWRLPNNFELKAIHNQLRKKGKGNIKKNAVYLSSEYLDFYGNPVSAVLGSNGKIQRCPMHLEDFFMLYPDPVYVRAVRSLP